MKLEELPQVMALSTEEKLRLIEELWESIHRGADGLGISAEEEKLLDQRWEKYLKNPASALTTDQFDDLLAKRRK